MNKTPSLILLLIFIVIVGCTSDDSSPAISLKHEPVTFVENTTIDKEIKFKLNQGEGFIVIKVMNQRFYIDYKDVDYMLWEEGFSLVALDGSFEIEVNLLNNGKGRKSIEKINDDHRMNFDVHLSRRVIMNVTVEFYKGRKKSLKKVLKILRGVNYT